MRAGRVLIVGILALPLFALAQVQDDQLKSQIRTDLMKDLRTAQLSSAEIDAMVSILADEAKKEGVAQDYLEAQNTFNYAALFPPPHSTLSGFLLSPIVIAFVSLAVILLLVVLYMIRQRKARQKMAFMPDA